MLLSRATGLTTNGARVPVSLARPTGQTTKQAGLRRDLPALRVKWSLSPRRILAPWSLAPWYGSNAAGKQLDARAWPLTRTTGQTTKQDGLRRALPASRVRWRLSWHPSL